jgi:hypothetical protein
MAQTTKLECSHCGFGTKTSDDIPRDKSIACPRCRLPMEIMRPPGAVEEANAPSFTDDLEPVLSTRASRTKMAQKRALVSNRPPPFHQSRSFIAAVSVTVIALVVLVLFVLYRDTIGQLGRGMKVVEKNRLNKFQAPDLARKSEKPKLALAKPINIVDEDRGPGTKTKEDQGPVVAPAEARVGDLMVNVSAAMLAKVAYDNPNQCLVVKLRIQNQSKKPITFVSWSQPDYRVALVDSRGKQYNRLEPMVQDPAVIDPGEAVVDSVAFEETPLVGDLALELEVAGRERPIRFRIPGSLIRRSMGAAYDRGPAPQPIAAAPPPPQAPGVGIGQALRPTVKEDPLSREVNEEYNDGVSKLESRKRGKGGNEAVNLMRRGKADLLKKLAEKHSLTIDELRRMINEP